MLKEALEKIGAQAKEELAGISDSKQLEDLRVRLLGKKGELTAILKQMGSLSAEERPVIGQLANKVRADIEEQIEARKIALKDELTAKKL